MSRIVKIFSIIMIVFCVTFYFNTSYAIDLNLTNTEVSTEENASTTDEEVDVSTEDATMDEGQTTSDESTFPGGTDDTTATENPGEVSSTTVSNMDLPESNLGLANILNIVLIVIGILLILLSIAILIRLKQ